MHFKFIPKCIIALVLLSFSSCGLFGNKNEKSKTIDKQTDGCLDTLNVKVESYSKGELSEEEWKESFNCVVKQVNDFKKDVRGSETRNSYNRGDIGALIRKFIITKHSVSDQFIQSMFDLKAAWFGGNTEEITFAELDNFSDLMRFIERETTALIPYLKEYNLNPTPASSLRLSDAVANLGRNSEKYLSDHVGTYAISKDSFIPFAKELLTLIDGNVDLVDEYESFTRSAKVLLFGGDRNLIEARTWPKLVQELFSFYGLYNSYKNIDGKDSFTHFNFKNSYEKDEYYLELLKRVKIYTNRILVLNNGYISLDRINPVIDCLPKDFLESDKRLAIKLDLPSILNHLLKSKVNRSLDLYALNNVFSFVREAFVGQILVKKLYQKLPDAPTFDVVSNEISKKLTLNITNEERDALKDILDVNRSFVGLYPTEGSTMFFNYDLRRVRTENQLLQFLWFRKIIRFAFSSYATGPNGVAQTNDLTLLSKDFGNILKSFGKFSPDVTYEEVSAKRFREGNLFMPNSNGDEYLDQYEATYYLSFLFSSGTTTTKTWDKIINEWRSCSPKHVDEIGRPAVEALCFRDSYYKNVNQLWSSYPFLLNDFKNWSIDERNSFGRDFEIATRKHGYTDLPVGEYDIDSMSALPHYVESLMLRFDRNRDNVIDQYELMDSVWVDYNQNGIQENNEILPGAYTVFKNSLKGIKGLPSGELYTQSALTYVIKFGQVPNTKQFLGWHAKRILLGRKAWKNVYADRASLYRVLAVLSEAL